MTRHLRLVGRLALTVACVPIALAAQPTQSAQAAKSSAEETAVLAAMDRYVAAITAKDSKAMTAMQTPEGMTYRTRVTETGAWVVAPRSRADMASAPDDGKTHRERYWTPTVHVRGAIAVVWAPYEFWLDGKTSHCGIDVFDFVKVNDEWRVANAMWTVEPNACAELRPKDASAIRPRD